VLEAAPLLPGRAEAKIAKGDRKVIKKSAMYLVNRLKKILKAKTNY
jgi:hypothetical protein